jgi:hypothetical protein
MSTPYGGDGLPDPGWHDPDAPSLFYRSGRRGRSQAQSAGADSQAASRPLIHFLQAGDEPPRSSAPPGRRQESSDHRTEFSMITIYEVG